MSEINGYAIANEIADADEMELIEFNFSNCFVALREYERLKKENIELKKHNNEMLELLETFENDDNQLPKWLWFKIKNVVAMVKGA